MLITIQENLPHSSGIVRVADFFLWPLTHAKLRMQISSDWILKTTWSLSKSGFFCYSVSVMFIRGLSDWLGAVTIGGPGCTHVSGSWQKVPGRVWLQHLLMQWAWAAPSPTCILCTIPWHIPLSTHLYSHFYPAASIFFLHSSFLLNHSSKQQTPTGLPNTKNNNDNNSLCLLSSGAENTNWLSGFSPCFSYSNMAVTRHVA